MEPLKIERERILLAEGKDDERFLKKLISDHGAAGNGIQVIVVNGKSNFKKRLEGIVAAASATTELLKIGVVRDADDDSGNSFKSVSNAVRGAGFAPPDRHGRFSSGRPSVGIFIMPDGANTGAIESLLRQFLKDGPETDTAACWSQVWWTL